MLFLKRIFISLCWSIQQASDTISTILSKKMSKNVILEYQILNLSSMPNQSRLANISKQNTSKRWIMSTLQNYFIFTIRLKAPSTIRIAQIKGNNTYKLDLTFKDQHQRYLCERSISFDQDHNAHKIIQIWDHPKALYIDVKMFNTQTTFKMGLGYLIFKGKYQILTDEEWKKDVPDKKKIFDQRKKNRQNQIVIDQDSPMIPENPAPAFDYYEQTIAEGGRGMNDPNHNAEYGTQLIVENDNRPTQEIIDLQQKPERPFSQQQLQYQILDPSCLDNNYVTFKYEPDNPCWNPLRLVKSQWVIHQRNIENQRGIRDQDRMSSKVQVLHLYKMKVLVEGLDPQRRHIIESTAVALGAEILQQPEMGCLVVSTRQYGQKLKSKRTKYKNTKFVIEEFILNCKGANVRPNEADYEISRK